MHNTPPAPPAPTAGRPDADDEQVALHNAVECGVGGAGQGSNALYEQFKGRNEHRVEKFG